MKNSEEMVNSLLERRNQYETEQRNRRKVMKRVVTPICCFCLVAILGIGLWQGDFFKSTPPIELDDTTHIGENDWGDDKDFSAGDSGISGHYRPNGQEIPQSDLIDSASSEASDGNTANGKLDKLLFYVNQIENTASAKFKYLEPAEHYEETWDADKTAQYLGIYLNNIGQGGLKYQGDGKHAVTYKNNGELARDIMSFEYSFKDTTVIVSTSKIGYPYDCIYELDENKETTFNLDGKSYSVKFAASVGSKSEQQPELMELFVADFENNGVKYRVKAENISHIDFYKVVKSVITG